MSYKKIQKMANKKSKYKKITSALKEKLRTQYVQGELDSQGFRRLESIENLADENQLSKNTLYKLAQREKWKEQQQQFQAKYQETLDKKRMKEFSVESKKFDSACINIAKAILSQVGKMIRDSSISNNSTFTPQQLDSLAGASLKVQKFAKLALGESTDNIKLDANINETEAFREVMELLDTVAEQRREGDSKAIH